MLYVSSLSTFRDRRICSRNGTDQLPEDLAVKNFNKCHSTVEFWEQVTERKYPKLK